MSDLEGISCISMSNYTKQGTEYLNVLKSVYEWFAQMGFNSIICDIHNDGDYVRTANVDRRVYKAGIGSLDITAKYDFAILIGFHGMEGAKGILTHTFKGEIKELKIGDKKAGEITTFITWLWEHNIPVSAVVGATGIEDECAELQVPYFISKTEKSDYFVNEISLLDEIIKERGLIRSVPNKKIRISFYNEDIATWLSQNTSFIVDENECIFSDVNEFINNVISLCLEINKGAKWIISRNLDFVEKLKQKNIKRDKFTKKIMHQVLIKSLDRVTEKDISLLKGVIGDEGD
ncbi:MAG: M55 family metallopeptidase [Lachnospiraceae bacterium]|nr:M55 family metallopeptidase [Lachnospiraceae bacterium]